MTRAAGNIEGCLDLGDCLASVLFLPARQLAYRKATGKADQKNDRDKDNLGHGYFPEVQVQRYVGPILIKKDQEQNEDDNDGYRFRFPHKKFLHFLEN
jgi:hypothetical protein